MDKSIVERLRECGATVTMHNYPKSELDCEVEINGHELEAFLSTETSALRKKLQSAEAKIAMLRESLECCDYFICDSYPHTHQHRTMIREALSATSESSAKFLAGVKADAVREFQLALVERLQEYESDEAFIENIIEEVMK